ncbi:MAG: hypothetical protein QOH62_3294 [Solirubrobacteraceae bacterium]|nr:hypothetical protein [Solirubrobacteraceae bacterium]
MNSTTLGIALAIAAAVALNASYLLQHAGSSGGVAVDARRPLATLAGLLRSPAWAAGAVVGITGWGLHIGAMRQAPLSLVQAFLAGGLALAAPMAAIGLRRRPAPGELHAIGLMVLALVLLSLGLHAGARHAGFSAAALGAALAGLGLAAALLSLLRSGERRPLALGLAGGLLYGAADLALKAVTGLHGAGAVFGSPWLLAALLCTVGAFFAFQRALQSDRPVAVIALMTAGTNVSSIAGAFLVFGDRLGTTPLLVAIHALAFVLVIVAAWRLAPAQAQLSVPVGS